MLQGKASIFEHFGPWRIYSSLFCTFGIDDRIRGSVWCMLLDIQNYRSKFVKGFYTKLLAMESSELEKLIDNDNIT